MMCNRIMCAMEKKRFCCHHLVNGMKCLLGRTICGSSARLPSIVKVWVYHNQSSCSFIVVEFAFYMLCLCKEQRAYFTEKHAPFSFVCKGFSYIEDTGKVY